MAEINPRVEYERFTQISLLRKKWNDITKSTFNSIDHKGFNNWLYDQLSSSSKESTTGDPILKHPEIVFETENMKNEILSNFFGQSYISWKKKTDSLHIEKIFKNYIGSLSSFLKRNVGKSVDAEIGIIENLISEVIKTKKYTLESFERFKLSIDSSVKTILSPLFNKVFKFLVEETKNACLEIEKIKTETDTNDYQITIESHSKDMVKITCNFNNIIAGEEKVVSTSTLLSKQAMEKIEKNINPDFGEHHKMLIFCLVKRYENFFSEGSIQSSAMHSSLPWECFEVLSQELSVNHECYASPFNSQLKNFCSAFGDIDPYFGSSGSFLDFYPISGSYEVGPPYTEYAMEKMAMHVVNLLQSSQEPLSFVVIVPDWRLPLSQYQENIENSIFLRDSIVLKGSEHLYNVGDKQLQSEEKQKFVVPFDTHFYILQNDQGAIKYPVRQTLLNLKRMSLKMTKEFLKM